MLTLHHTTRAVCPQKVRLALAEKELPYESRLLTRADLRSSEYLALNPGGYAPTLIHDDKVITESRTISEYLENAFPLRPLMPASAIGKANVRNWTKQVDDSLHLNIFVVSFVTSSRPMFIALSPEAQQKALPLTPIKRHIALELADQGDKSVFFGMAVNRFEKLVADMNTVLLRSEWLSGDAYSFADVDLTPYIRRLQELGLWQLLSERNPEVARWFDAVCKRPSFERAITSWESEGDQMREALDIKSAQSIFKAALAA